MIEFLCPNGHKIHCPDAQAGWAAKCPRCGVKFRIPSLSETPASDAVRPDSTISLPDLTGSSASVTGSVAGSNSGSSSGSGRQRLSTKESQIEFLCPNGHLLHGPSSLQGRPGECPECGSRFRIPNVQESESDSSVEDEIRLDGNERGKKSGLEDTAPSLQTTDTSGPAELSRVQPQMAGALSSVDLPAESLLEFTPARHPLGPLFAKLWDAKGDGSRVEVHLSSGGVLLPDGYVSDLSQQDYAVLMSQDPDGSRTLTVVPWSGVARVIVRGVKRVPGNVVS
jgi:hypothetical protein